MGGDKQKRETAATSSPEDQPRPRKRLLSKGRGAKLGLAVMGVLLATFSSVIWLELSAEPDPPPAEEAETTEVAGDSAGTEGETAVTSPADSVAQESGTHAFSTGYSTGGVLPTAGEYAADDASSYHDAAQASPEYAAPPANSSFIPPDDTAYVGASSGFAASGYGDTPPVAENPPADTDFAPPSEVADDPLAGYGAAADQPPAAEDTHGESGGAFVPAETEVAETENDPSSFGGYGATTEVVEEEPVSPSSTVGFSGYGTDGGEPAETDTHELAAETEPDLQGTYAVEADSTEASSEFAAVAENVPEDSDYSAETTYAPQAAVEAYPPDNNLAGTETTEESPAAQGGTPWDDSQYQETDQPLESSFSEVTASRWDDPAREASPMANTAEQAKASAPTKRSSVQWEGNPLNGDSANSGLGDRIRIPDDMHTDIENATATQGFSGEAEQGFRQPRGQPSPRTVASDPPLAQSLRSTAPGVQEEHVLGVRETFQDLSRRYYGSPAYYRAVYEFNRRANPRVDRFVPGDRVQIPELATLQRYFPDYCPRDETGRGPQVAEDRRQNNDPRREYYEVRAGDTMQEIARRELGASSRWRDIYELNHAAIHAAQRKLRPGMRLRLPATAHRERGTLLR